MLNLDTRPLAELYDYAWYLTDKSHVIDLVWKGERYQWSSTTHLGTFIITLNPLDDDYELRTVAYDFDFKKIFHGENVYGELSLLLDVETAKKLCQDRFNELVLACLK